LKSGTSLLGRAPCYEDVREMEVKIQVYFTTELAKVSDMVQTLYHTRRASRVPTSYYWAGDLEPMWS